VTQHTNKHPAVSGTPTFFEQMASKSSVPHCVSSLSFCFSYFSPPLCVFLLILQSVLLYGVYFLHLPPFPLHTSLPVPKSLPVFLFAISSFSLLVYRFFSFLFLFIVRFPNSCFLPTYRQIPTSPHLATSLLPPPPFPLST
jgi:hypothetical protein